MEPLNKIKLIRNRQEEIVAEMQELQDFPMMVLQYRELASEYSRLEIVATSIIRKEVGWDKFLDEIDKDLNS